MTLSFKTTKTQGKTLVIASISDIHLGHRRTPTSHIVAALEKFASNSKLLSKVDLFFLAGDVFDDLLMFSSEEVVQSETWIARFLRRCHRYNVTVRVLEGTPSHDRKQSISFLKINAILAKHNHEADLKYIDSVHVEINEKLGVSILYVPDEWRHDTSDTLECVREQMQAKGVTQVDFACMHGMFTYQVPEMSKLHIKHVEAEYLTLVRSLIFIGHVHGYSNFERIYSHGSFDRLAHGEEDPKGFILATVQADGDYVAEFVENTDALTYVTYRCFHDDLEESLQFLDRRVQKLRPGSHVRIESKKKHPIAHGLETLNSRWPHLSWSFLLKDKDKEKPKTSDALIDQQQYVPLIINRESIGSLVTDRLKNKNVSATLIETALAQLHEAL